MNRITYIGHATLLLEIDGVRLLTDPLLLRRVSHLWRAAPLPLSQLNKLDAVLISHLHGDHLHIPSLRLLGQDVHLIAPVGSSAFLKSRGFINLTEVAAGQVIDINGIKIEATTAVHEGPPVPGRPITDALGYIIYSSRPIYFAGDTDIFPEMATIGKVINIALLPVWGYGPTLGAGHMNPLRAAESLRLLRPELAIPIHWGTYFPIGLATFMPQFLRLPAWQFVEHAKTLAPEVHTVILQPGYALDLPAD